MCSGESDGEIDACGLPSDGAVGDTTAEAGVGVVAVDGAATSAIDGGDACDGEVNGEAAANEAAGAAVEADDEADVGAAAVDGASDEAIAEGGLPGVYRPDCRKARSTASAHDSPCPLRGLG